MCAVGADEPWQPAVLQRWTPKRAHSGVRAGARGVWRTIVRLRADRHGILNVLVKLAEATRLRLVSGALVSAAGSVPRGQSRL